MINQLKILRDKILNKKYENIHDITTVTINNYLCHSKDNDSIDFRRLLINYFSGQIRTNIKFNEAIYCLNHNILSIPICKRCSSNVKFATYTRGYRDYCSTSCSRKANSVKIAETNLKLYGVDNPSKNKKIYAKIITTNLLRYGSRSPIGNIDVYNKMINTTLKRYKVTHYSKTPQFKEKFQTTSIKNYGVPYPIQSKRAKDKRKITCNNLYGVEFTLQIDTIRKSIQDASRKYMISKIFDGNRANAKPLFLPDDYTTVDCGYLWECSICHTQFFDDLHDGTNARCYKCEPKLRGPSSAERDILKFCNNHDIKAKTSDRTILNGREIDILISELNLGIEFNGLYWHSEAQGKDSGYHISKTILAESKGIKLIHIFEDEWFYKKEIIKSILLSKLDNITETINANQCSVKITSNEEAEEFLISNDLDGYIDGMHFGLYHEEILVCVLTMEKKNDDKIWNILRFTTKINMKFFNDFNVLFRDFSTTYKPRKVSYRTNARFNIRDSRPMRNFDYVKTSQPSKFYLTETGREIDESFCDCDIIWDCGCHLYEWVRK